MKTLALATCVSLTLGAPPSIGQADPITARLCRGGEIGYWQPVQTPDGLALALTTEDRLARDTVLCLVRNEQRLRVVEEEERP